MSREQEKIRRKLENNPVIECNKVRNSIERSPCAGFTDLFLWQTGFRHGASQNHPSQFIFRSFHVLPAGTADSCPENSSSAPALSQGQIPFSDSRHTAVGHNNPLCNSSSEHNSPVSAHFTKKSPVGQAVIRQHGKYPPYIRLLTEPKRNQGL